MTKETARLMGLVFAGIYDRTPGSEMLKKGLRDIRKLGYKAHLVTVPDDPLTRGYKSKGYSIYVEPRYFTDTEIRLLQQQTSNQAQANRLKLLSAEYDAAVAEAERMHSERLKRLKKLQQHEKSRRPL